MLTKYVDETINKVPGLQERAESLAHTIHSAVLSGGEPVRNLMDLLHGKWLGHPLHPVLTDIVVGSWSLAALFDLWSLGGRSPQAEQAADTLTAVGTTAAIPTALSGVADFSAIPKNAAKVGLVHAIATDISFGLYLLSLWDRKKGRRGRGMLWSTLGMGAITIGAYLGGHLVFDKRVGVNRSEPASEPKAWTPVLSEQALPQGQLKRIEVEGQPVLLYRQATRVHAVGAVCPHAGGPLEDGDVYDHQVQCPWHDSVFDLEDGAVIHGPATYPLPNYQARIRDGQIEVRVAEG